MTHCMYLSCYSEAVSNVFVDTDHQPSPLAVCFSHERELVDRYGYENVQPRFLNGPIRTFTAKEAVSYLRGA